MIRSAVRTTLRSLLRSDLVAEMNQTVIDVQRTDSMMAVWVSYETYKTDYFDDVFHTFLGLVLFTWQSMGQSQASQFSSKIP